MTRRAALLAGLLLLLAQGARAQAPPVAETVAIPLIEKRLLGAPRELSLEAFLYRPASTGPLPVLVFNHGSTGAGSRLAGRDRVRTATPRSRASSSSGAGRS